jgi:hypothetical protein
MTVDDDDDDDYARCAGSVLRFRESCQCLALVQDCDAARLPGPAGGGD